MNHFKPIDPIIFQCFDRGLYNTELDVKSFIFLY